ncbi:MAG: DUF1854 domain-containing protein [Clostridia bacterium]|nr:DUF1854 domain-containing protein [Clostridia bacterium]
MKDSVFTLADAAGIVYLTKDTAHFFKEGDFIGADIKGEDGETTHHLRVWLHRSFPLDMPFEYISVQNKDQEELGLIKSISDFDADERDIITAELERKYYTPTVTKIITLKETRGFSFWRVMTDAGELSFTLQDTSKSIARVGADRAFIFDICGNRYEIRSLSALDKNSYRKLELYL